MYIRGAEEFEAAVAALVSEPTPALLVTGAAFELGVGAVVDAGAGELSLETSWALKIETLKAKKRKQTRFLFIILETHITYPPQDKFF
jgi:hypothetical protein